MFISAIGQDSHRFESEGSSKPLLLGGVVIPGCVGLNGNSDADVILHALTNAISGLSSVNILGKISDDMCKQGITDSKAYLVKALDTLGSEIKLKHVSMTIEAKRPHLSLHIPVIRDKIAQLLSLEVKHVGITATTGEGLTGFGRGEGIQVFVILSAICND